MLGLGQVCLAAPSESKAWEASIALWLEVRLVSSGSLSSTAINSLSAWELAAFSQGVLLMENHYVGKWSVVVSFWTHELPTVSPELTGFNEEIAWWRGFGFLRGLRRLARRCCEGQKRETE